MATEAARWHLLMHQVPTKPDYLRVKVSRRLQKIGAVPIRNGVYALPASDAAQEDLAWTLSEIIAAGGEGSIIEARFLQGVDDDEVVRRFRSARDQDYAPLAADLKAVLAGAETPTPSEVDKARRRLAEIVATDFFGAAGRREVEDLLAAIDARGRASAGIAASPAPDWTGRVWVTRAGVKVDRIASAWLVRRFVDPDARFKFVDARGYSVEPGEVRFDMSPAEFTHEGQDCTFEVLIRRLGVSAPGVAALAEVVHDIDLKDAHFGRPEAAGVAALIDGIAATTDDDDERLRQGFAAFDALKAALAKA